MQIQNSHWKSFKVDFVTFGLTQANFAPILSWSSGEANKLVAIHTYMCLVLISLLSWRVSRRAWCLLRLNSCLFQDFQKWASWLVSAKIKWHPLRLNRSRSGICDLLSPRHVTLMTPFTLKALFLAASVASINLWQSPGNYTLRVSRPVLLSFGMSVRLTRQSLMSVRLKSGLLSWTDYPEGDPAKAANYLLFNSCIWFRCAVGLNSRQTNKN